MGRFDGYVSGDKFVAYDEDNPAYWAEDNLRADDFDQYITDMSDDYDPYYDDPYYEEGASD